MDGLTALSIAANIISVVDCTTKVASIGKQLYAAGTTEQYEELKRVTQSLTHAVDLLKGSLASNQTTSLYASQQDHDLRCLAIESNNVSQDLLKKLNKLDLASRRSVWRATLTAFRAVWNESEIEALKDRLEAIQSVLHTTLLVYLKGKIEALSADQRAYFAKNESQANAILQAVTTGHNSNRTAIAVQIQDLNIEADRRHEEVLSSIKGKLGNRAYKPASRKKVDEAVLRSIFFDQIYDRRDNIMPAHSRTFGWLFSCSQNKDQPNTGFRNWLEQGDGIYWINGKAGSGKSTLMKFLTEDHRTIEALQKWSASTPLAIPSFYFWNRGTQLQKSVGGLYRSLLYEILKSHRFLIGIAFPNHHLQSNTADPTTTQLRAALERLLNYCHLPIKLCIFIDGLDEYEGDGAEMSELARFMTCITQASNVKAVLSSRPELPYEEAFGRFPKLALQDLTFTDIVTSVHDNILENARMQKLSIEQPEGVNDLVTAIVAKAEGVFLWVKLVVNSLLEGLRNHDRVCELFERLEELPADLEALYKHMLRKISPRYRSQAFRLMSIVRTYTPPPLRSHSLEALTCSFATENLAYVMKCPTRPLTPQAHQDRLDDISAQLKSRCCGLLEVRHSHRDSVEAAKEPSPDEPFVQFLHKSVADFFDQPTTRFDLMTEKDEDFDPCVAILYGHVLRCKTMIWSKSSRCDALPADAMYFSRLAELSTGKAHANILDHMDAAVTRIFIRDGVADFYSREPYGEDYDIVQRSRAHWSDFLQEDFSRPAAWHDTFFSLAVRSGLYQYVEEKIKENGGRCPEKRGRPLLDYAVRPEPGYQHYIDAVDTRIVTALLNGGSDPNEKFNGWTPWQNALYCIVKLGPLAEDPKFLANLSQLASHGADLSACCERKNRVSNREWISEKYTAEQVVRDAWLSDCEVHPGKARTSPPGKRDQRNHNDTKTVDILCTCIPHETQRDAFALIAYILREEGKPIRFKLLSRAALQPSGGKHHQKLPKRLLRWHPKVKVRRV